MGLLENATKIKKEKNQPQQKTACKTVKTDKFSHPSYQNPNRYDGVVTSGAYGGFAAISDRRRRTFAAQIEMRPEPKKKNQKPHRMPNPKIF